MTEQTKDYLSRKQFFDSLLTIYGRKPVLEALQDPKIALYRLHLAESNRQEGIVNEILALAEKRGVEVCYHDRKALSRISKNTKQDQGVAADLQLQSYRPFSSFISEQSKPYRLIALDGVTNPQNLGMIIRSVAAGHVDGLLLPQKGCAKIDPLVIKASTGTVFKAPIFYCETLKSALEEVNPDKVSICSLALDAKDSWKTFTPKQSVIYVLGNETEGVSKEVSALCNSHIRIPMNNGVESLNVAVTAALLAFS
ncbi:MAG: RNA methyltransferase [Cellvibrionaceae bacterium]